MANICEFKSDKDLFCDLGLSQAIDVDCNSFIKTIDSIFDNDVGFEFNVNESICSEQFSRLTNFMKSAENVYMFCPSCK